MSSSSGSVLKHLECPGRFIRLFPELSSDLTDSELVILSELINEFCRVFPPNSEEYLCGEEYFPYSSKKLEERINKSKAAQKKQLKKLIDKGFVEVKILRFPTRRMIRLRWGKITNILETKIDVSPNNHHPNGGQTEPQNHHLNGGQTKPLSYKEKGSYKENCSRQKVTSKLTSHSPPISRSLEVRSLLPECEPPHDDEELERNKICDELENVLMSKRMLTAKPSRKEWINEIKLLQKCKYTNPEIMEMIAWLKDNIGKPYTPLVFSAKTFRAKVPAIFYMMKRSQAPADDREEFRRMLNERQD